MDPVTGIGLASSVIQIVTFGIQAAGVVKDVYRQGSVSQYNDLGKTTDHLRSLTRSLGQSLQTSGGQTPDFSKDEKDLLQLGWDCESCARKLQEELQKLQSQQPRASKLEAARIAFRAIRKSSKIEEISKALKDHQAILETSLLHNLRCVPSYMHFLDTMESILFYLLA